MASEKTADYLPHIGFEGMSVLAKSSLGVMSAVFLAVVFGRLLSVHLDPQEPPALKPSIPFIGHLIGMLRFRSNFLSVLLCATVSLSFRILEMLMEQTANIGCL